MGVGIQGICEVKGLAQSRLDLGFLKTRLVPLLTLSEWFSCCEPALSADPAGV